MDDLLDLHFSSSHSPGSSNKPLAPSKPSHLQGTPTVRPSSPFDSLLTPSSSQLPVKPFAPGLISSSPSLSPTPSAFAALTPSSTGRNLSGSTTPFNRTSSPTVSSNRSGISTPNSGGNLYQATLNKTLSSGVASPSSSGSNDAFSALLTLDSNASTLANGGTQRLSLLEQQERLSREKKEKEERERATFDFSSWDAGPQSARNGSYPSIKMGPVPVSTSPSSFPATVNPSRSQTDAPKLPISIDNLRIFGSEPPSIIRPTSAGHRSSGPKDPWEFDGLNSASGHGQHHETRSPKIETAVAKDWFADFDDHPSGSSSLPDSTIGRQQEKRNKTDALGIPSKSAESVRRNSPEDDTIASPVRPRQRTTTPSQSKTARSRSPPPHILGQIVEMGFSPSQARSALAATESGVDVEAALETLLAGQGRSDSPANGPRDGGRPRAPERIEDMDDDAIAKEAAERRRRRRQGPSRATTEQPDGDRDGSTPDFNVQADKLLSQASEIGLNMFTKANSLWNTGKERAQKLYEERAAALAAEAGRKTSGTSSATFDGRPKWMIQAEEDEAREKGQHSAKKGKGGSEQRFVDSDDEEGPEQPTRQAPSRTNGGPTRELSTRKTQSKPSVSTRPRINGADERETPRMRTPVATPVPKNNRLRVPIDPDQLQRSNALRNQGNETFKLGRFSEAVDLYTAAIEVLPPQHLLLVPLWNNRASANLKQGEHASTIRDCTSAIDLIGVDYHPAKENPLVDEVANVKLAEGLFKAYSKRASAHEMAEKWAKAKEDWEFLMGSPMSAIMFSETGGANHRKMVSDGLLRSRKMLESSASSDVALPPRPASTKPKPPPKPATPVQLDKSEGVAKMRQAALAQEKEDNLRHSLKTTVDAKVAAWSSGKNTNLRALLGSLEMVLWPELNLKKVSMADLITEKQVKIAYMKVIGKLHPDKLNPSNTTVEQRMIANSVFGILNEAWNAFQSSS